MLGEGLSRKRWSNFNHKYSILRRDIELRTSQAGLKLFWIRQHRDFLSICRICQGRADGPTSVVQKLDVAAHFNALHFTRLWYVWCFFGHECCGCFGCSFWHVQTWWLSWWQWQRLDFTESRRISMWELASLTLTCSALEIGAHFQAQPQPCTERW